MPGTLKGRDLVIDIKKQTISAGVKGQGPVLKVRLPPYSNPPDPYPQQQPGQTN